MFTGIVAAIGEIAAVEPLGGDLRLRIRSGDLDLSDAKPGDSIATNGVCLTAVELPGDGFCADISRETLAHSTLAQARIGQRVNLEKALPTNGRFDGHIVSGHVDGVAKVLQRQEDARSIRLTLEAPQALARYIATKGSVCVDGVSLTVNRVVKGAQFELNIVPHTASQTIIADYTAGTRVNIEVDIIARYLERLLIEGRAAAGESTMTAAFLAEHGYINKGI